MGRIAATRRGFTASAVLLVALLFLGLMAAPASATTTLEREMLRLTNQSRADHDLPRLRLNSSMSTKVHKHSGAMARFGEIYHTEDPADSYLRGVRWSRWGENVGRTDGDLEGLEDAFMASPVHRRNILDDRFDRVAVGVVQRDGTSWVTLFFYG